jgi:hypothetical protein
MCDYSLEMIKSRAAADNEDIVIKQFNTGSKGFVDPVDADCAVCVKSGAELTIFLPDRDYNVVVLGDNPVGETTHLSGELSVVFHTLPKPAFSMYHDGVILPDGRWMSMQALPTGTRAVITKALPIELTEAAKGEVAFKEEDRIADVAPLVQPAHV